MAKIFCIWGGRFKDKHANNKKYCKTRDHFQYRGEYRDAVQGMFDLKYGKPKEIVVFFQKSNYHYRFIIKDLAK